jgi:hypothetical protein
VILPPVSENADVVRAFVEAVNRGRLEDQVALAHPQYQMNESSLLPGAAQVKGPEELRSYAYGWVRNWSEWEWREQELIELPPDRVLFDSMLRLRGLRSSIWVEHRWAYLFEIRDGLILRQDAFQTKEEILERVRSPPW